MKNINEIAETIKNAQTCLYRPLIISGQETKVKCENGNRLHSSGSLPVRTVGML